MITFASAHVQRLCPGDYAPAGQTQLAGLVMEKLMTPPPGLQGQGEGAVRIYVHGLDVVHLDGHA